MKQDIPNSKNFCGGNFKDWLEVNLLERCNANCEWCIEKKGYHPKHHATVDEIATAAINSGKKNIALLGGEPLLYKDIQKLIRFLRKAGKNVTVTTNGYLLTEEYVYANLQGLSNINISIHHWQMQKNEEITKVFIDAFELKKSIGHLKKSLGVSVRMNCNLISGYIDCKKTIYQYIDWAKYIGADKVRFAELKDAEESFVDLTDIFGTEYGINGDPFLYGCNSDCHILDMPVNFRQMCGLQTNKRPRPINPKQEKKQVLYYDGKIYDGWQIMKEIKMNVDNTFLIKQLLNAKTGEKLNDAELDDLLYLIKSIVDDSVEKSMTQYKAEVIEKIRYTDTSCAY